MVQTMAAILLFFIPGTERSVMKWFMRADADVTPEYISTD